MDDELVGSSLHLLTVARAVASDRMDELRELERLGDSTWPALERIEYDGWLVRFGGGVTRRSNCVTPLRASSLPLDEKVDVVDAMFAVRGLPPTYRITPLAEASLVKLLGARGYEHDRGADVMTRPVDERVDAGSVSVRIGSRPSPEWMRSLSDFGDDRGNPEAMTALLSLVECGAYATVEEAGEIAAMGMATVAEGCIGIFNMNTRPAHRRRGLGRDVLRALLAWGRDRGASRALLQVHPTSTAAIALYRAEGFVVRYSYSYLSAPPRGET